MPDEHDDRFEYTADGVPSYPPEHWGRDHASLLLYVETRHLDHQGEIFPDNLRTNRPRHPHEWDQRRDADSNWDWRPEYGTRLADGTRPSTEHDDWDCLEDMEEQELLISTGAPNLLVALSEYGVEVAGELRKFKGRGNPISEFDWERAMAEAKKKVDG